MSVIRVKNPETGNWEVQSTGLSVSLAENDTYGIVKAGDGVKIEHGVISIDDSYYTKKINNLEKEIKSLKKKIQELS